MTCKGICIRYKADRTQIRMRYISGQKRCQVCLIFIVNWQGLFCPCCGGKLRNKPKNKKLKLTLISNIIKYKKLVSSY
jgi:hypothetical protein